MRPPDADTACGRPGSDLRLPLAAAGAWAAALAGLYGTADSGLCTMLACATVVLAANRCRRRVAAAVATCAFGGVLASGVTAVHVAARDAEALARLIAAEATGAAELVISSPPKASARTVGVYTVQARLRSFGTALAGGDAAAAADSGGPDGAAEVSGNWRVLLIGSGDAWVDVIPGHRIGVTAVLREPDPGRLTAAVVSARGPPEVLAEPPPHQRVAAHVRTGLVEAAASVEGPAAGLIPGLAVGDTSQLDPSLAADFRTTGLVHLVVTSGYHVAIVTTTVLGAVVLLRGGPGVRVAVGAAAVVVFVTIVGPQPSVLRASVMAGSMLLALALGRPRAALPALAAAVLVLVLADPDMAARPGFALSVAACAGLLLLAFRWAKPLEHRGWPLWAALAVTIPAATQAAVTPLLAAWTGEVSIVSIPVNLLATVLAAPAVILAVVTAAAAALWPPAGEWCAHLAAIPARWLVALASTGADVPGGVLPWPEGTWWGVLAGLLTAVVVGLLHVRKLRRPVLAALVAAILGVVPACLLTSGPPSGWVVTMCDVGQGDAVVLPAGDAAVVVDVGPDPIAVADCLDALGVDRIALLVISHFHIDHVAGIGGAVSGRQVDVVLAPPPGEAELGYEMAAEHLGGVTVVDAVPGTRYRFGETRIEVLGPPERLLIGTRSDPNNNSVFLRADVGGTSVLLTGDLEIEAQEHFLRTAASLDVDVLKVPHHGSAFQAREFLAATEPAVALVGVGDGNSYGHPNPGTLGVLEDAGAAVFRTDTDGSITVVRDGDAFRVMTRPNS